MATKRKQRHIVAVSEEEWEAARRIGEAQSIPVSPSTVLRAAIKHFLGEKGQALQGKSIDQRHKR